MKKIIFFLFVLTVILKRFVTIDEEELTNLTLLWVCFLGVCLEVRGCKITHTPPTPTLSKTR